ncbi:MAG: PaaI family thioesterase [bacterium]
MSDKWEDDHYCIACGDKHPWGMHLKFEVKDNVISTKYAFPKEMQGYKDIVHGGMIALLLDETMVNLPWKKIGIPVVSADLKIRLKKPLAVGELVTAKAWFVSEKSRIFIVNGEIRRDRDNELVAEGEAVCVKVQLENLKKNL